MKFSFSFRKTGLKFLYGVYNNKESMKKIIWLCAAIIVFISCKKDYSLENGSNLNNGLIVGIDCRLSKISTYDSASGVPLGSIAANINAKDTVTDITQFDSLAFTILFYTPISYNPDTIHINADEYFVADATQGGRIKLLHGLTDPADPFSPPFDADYTYNASNQLVTKSYSFSSSPGIPYYVVDYTYTGGNLSHMTGTDMFFGELIVDADINYFVNITPKNFLYLFPDELTYTHYNQFFNFGKRPSNAVKDLKVRYYDPGLVVRDSTVSRFNTYIMSRDNYVLSVYMNGDDQFSIPAEAGKLTFSYKCK